MMGIDARGSKVSGIMPAASETCDRARLLPGLAQRANVQPVLALRKYATDHVLLVSWAGNELLDTSGMPRRACLYGITEDRPRSFPLLQFL